MERNRSIMKKFFVMTLVLALLAGVFPIAAAGSDWDGTAASAFAGGSGTEGDPYRITTAAELAYFSQAVTDGTLETAGAFFALDADVTLNSGDAAAFGTDGNTAKVFSPIGCADHKFAGTFDGRGYTISGMYVNINNECAGLFAWADSTAVIKDLVIVNSRVMGMDPGNEAGGLVGCALPGAVISGIYCDAIVTGVCDGTGGIVGIASSKSSTTLTVTGCVFAGTVGTRDRKWVGGIVGNGNNRTVEITDCLNLGTVIGFDYVGGIIGIDNKDSAVISHCVNIGTVDSIESNTGAFINTNKAAKASGNVWWAYSALAAVSGSAVEEDTVCAESFDALYGITATAAGSLGSGWVTRANDVLIPAALISFAPDSAYYGHADGDLTPATEAPTEAPTAAPTEAPTAAPTEAPTAAPTEAPADAPTEAPTAAPSDAGTADNSPESTAPAAEKKGCGSAVCVGLLPLAILAGAALRRKENDR